MVRQATWPEPTEGRLLEQFEGPAGRRRLLEALCQQALVCDDEALAAELADSVTLHHATPGAVLIAHGATDNVLLFILAGQVCVEVNGRELARRNSGEHVGEMAVVDPSAFRSADITAVTPTVVARIEEAAFTRIADRYPRVWRRTARILANRLRQQSDHGSRRNATPGVFIGCSTTALPVARELRSLLKLDSAAVRAWPDTAIAASTEEITELEGQLRAADVAVLVLGPNDAAAGRDNVIFELGLFIGALTRRRTILVRPRGIDLAIPAELLGLACLDYADGPAATLTERLTPLRNELRRTIASLGAR